jgi:hypothetical protein
MSDAENVKNDHSTNILLAPTFKGSPLFAFTFPSRQFDSNMSDAENVKNNQSTNILHKGKLSSSRERLHISDVEVGISPMSVRPRLTH